MDLKQVGWKIGEAKQRFSEVVRATTQGPQKIYNRDRLVAVLIEAEAFGEFEAWQERRAKPSLEDEFKRLREIGSAEGLEDEPTTRRDRPNPFGLALDHVPG